MSNFTYNIATEGIRAGHRIFSVLGLKFLDVVIEVTPQFGAGGSGVPLRYNITIKVRYKEKSWNKTWKVTRSLYSKVIAKLLNGSTLINSTISALFKGKTITQVTGKIKNGNN